MEPLKGLLQKIKIYRLSHAHKKLSCAHMNSFNVKVSCLEDVVGHICHAGCM